MEYSYLSKINVDSEGREHKVNIEENDRNLQTLAHWCLFDTTETNWNRNYNSQPMRNERDVEESFHVFLNFFQIILRMFNVIFRELDDYEQAYEHGKVRNAWT